MTVMEIIRLVVGTVFLIAGLVVFTIEVYGIFHMNYILNRMHSAAMGDTMGLFLVMTGLCFYSGLNFTTLKIILTIVLFWIASPVASHMTALLELYTNERLSKHLTYEGDLETLEKRLEKEEKEEKN
ncbi:MAG: monovalent cation/H(+) antiporter subunit G [Lachnospiraceae bacterium]|nr:monovalent cation/H(+) antiporter subunit G [Lachnospiraceae bacterium]